MRGLGDFQCIKVKVIKTTKGIFKKCNYTELELSFYYKNSGVRCRAKKYESGKIEIKKETIFHGKEEDNLYETCPWCSSIIYPFETSCDIGDFLIELIEKELLTHPKTRLKLLTY